MKTKELLIVSTLFILFSGVISAQAPGTLDNSFGTGGKVITPIGTANDVIYSVAIQTDGKIVAAGYTVAGTVYSFALVRYSTDGTLDNSFGNGGKVVTPDPNNQGYIYSLAIQSDGKIVAGGVMSDGTHLKCAVARYNINGSLDSTFGTAGVVHTSVGPVLDYIYAIALQKNGKIVTAGYSDWSGKSSFTLLRYNPNGTLDNTFGNAGIDTTFFPGSTSASAKALKILADGRIIAVGSAYSNSNNDFAAAMYDSNGTLFGGFGSSGRVVTPVGTANDFANAVDVQSDNKIILAGSSAVGTLKNISLVRFNSDGTLDNTFGSGGKVIKIIGSGNCVAYAMKYVESFGICIAGSSNNGTNDDFTSALFNPVDGSLVSSYGASGYAITPVSTGYDWVYAMAFQKDGKIILAGYNYLTQDDFAVERLYGYTPTAINDNLSAQNPDNFALVQNYPNPFNPTTTIKFSVAEDGYADLKVYDMLGRSVTSLFGGYAQSGKYYEARFDGHDFASGIYYAQLKSHNNQKTIKMIMLK